MATQWVLVDPTGEHRHGGGDEVVRSLGPGPVRLGLFSNNKQNAAEIEAAIGEWARREHGAEVRTYLKPNASVPAGPDLIDRIVTECDVVVTGSGDCGSCTAATVHDTVTLRRRGLAVAMLTSDAFVELAHLQADALAATGIDLLVVAHPLGGITPTELHDRQDTAVAEFTPWWGRAVALAEPVGVR